ncbi:MULTISPECIES: DUF6344 domain-containing protein [Streptomyces]|uniref:DUF6344 domain-containing protein n=1 Tax=Streptomyces TaxID=1883 RepID=UPI0016718266|nr:MULTISPECIES: DUF6344 domain-containing protein [Streptomyces]UFR03492.1 DUF6344 domain-containing protein [Streptomyces sp. Go40/10]GGS58191.1 hypothetical protein GCM10010206_20080 [Streptomyces cinerochromogenes]
MARNKVMKLWTAIVTAFLALCTALGLVTAATAPAAAAGPRTESPHTGTAQRTAPTIPAARHWAWSHGKALPPTMKQRIRAEAHGKTPACRHRPVAENQTPSETTAHEDASDPSDPADPARRLDC